MACRQHRRPSLSAITPRPPAPKAPAAPPRGGSRSALQPSCRCASPPPARRPSSRRAARCLSHRPAQPGAATRHPLPRGRPAPRLMVHSRSWPPANLSRSRSRIPRHAVRLLSAVTFGRLLIAVGEGRIRIPPSLIATVVECLRRLAVAGPLVLPSRNDGSIFERPRSRLGVRTTRGSLAPHDRRYSVLLKRAYYRANFQASWRTNTGSGMRNAPAPLLASDFWFTPPCMTPKGSTGITRARFTYRPLSTWI